MLTDVKLNVYSSGSLMNFNFWKYVLLSSDYLEWRAVSFNSGTKGSGPSIPNGEASRIDTSLKIDVFAANDDSVTLTCRRVVS